MPPEGPRIARVIWLFFEIMALSSVLSLWLAESEPRLRWMEGNLSQLSLSDHT